MKFTPEEIAWLEEDPETLRAARNYHMIKDAEGEAAGYSTEFHLARARELEDEALRLESRHE